MAPTELWRVDLVTAAAALEAIEAATPRLSEESEARIAAAVDDGARRERRLAHIALRILLERRLGPSIRGVPFARTATGKPYLPQAGTSFSLAHTRGVALMAVGDEGPLGVDIERARAVRIPPARRPPIEAEAIALARGAPLASGDPDTRFVSAWVRIEAVAKARGTGLAPLLERLRPGGGAGASVRVAASETPEIVAYDIPAAEGLFAAVALAAAAPGPPALRLLPTTPPAIAALLD